MTFGVGQISSMSGDELRALEPKLRPYLERSCKEHNLSMLFFMLTNIIEESTTLMYYGDEAAALIEEAFPTDTGKRQRTANWRCIRGKNS